MKPFIFTGLQGDCHIQGIAVDPQKQLIYYSFTTRFIKSTFDGKILGTVEGLTGHLGCIDFFEEDGRVYGSLEYKCDKIGKGISQISQTAEHRESAFYIAIFDVDKIDRIGMVAELVGIMTAVYVKEATDAHNGSGKNKNGEPVKHKYGCSGIDGTAFGPMFGQQNDTKKYLFVAYGIYSDLTREDNNHQILLCYDPEKLRTFAKPLNQNSMHKSGPQKPEAKLFLYTGNTNYGVQNLEYDAFTHAYFMAVYPGKKPEYPNYYLFAADAAEAPYQGTIQGTEETGMLLSLLKKGIYHEKSNTYGWRFPFGSTGLYAFGDGTYYISEPHLSQNGHCSLILPYTWQESAPFVLDVPAPEKTDDARR